MRVWALPNKKRVATADKKKKRQMWLTCWPAFAPFRPYMHFFTVWRDCPQSMRITLRDMQRLNILCIAICCCIVVRSSLKTHQNQIKYSTIYLLLKHFILHTLLVITNEFFHAVAVSVSLVSSENYMPLFICAEIIYLFWISNYVFRIYSPFAQRAYSAICCSLLLLLFHFNFA